MIMPFIVMLLMAFGNVACNQTADESFDTSGIPGNPDDEGSGRAVDRVSIIEDTFEGEKIVIVGNPGKNYIVSFYKELDGVEYNFKTTTKSLPIIMEDDKGNQWDIFGEAIEGPDKGKKLTYPQSIMGYWFSIATFYPGTEIYPSNEKGSFAGKEIVGTEGWTVPKNRVVSGGPGKDGIPAVDNPKFASISGSSNDLVIGVKMGNTVRAYPHFILDWHEIVNDQINNVYFSVVYCPLTGTATVWDRMMNGSPTTFGVSGLLFNSNIIPYDRATSSNWSQLKDEAIFGNKKSTQPTHLQLVETTLTSWRQMYPESELLTTQTGFNRSYGQYPYGNYKINKSLIFNVQFQDDRLHLKERVHAIIIKGNARVYRFGSFD